MADNKNETGDKKRLIWRFRAAERTVRLPGAFWTSCWKMAA